MPRLLLTLGHALNSAPVYLGEIAGVVKDERDAGGYEAPLLAAAPDVVFITRPGKK